MSVLSSPHFHDEAKAFAYLESIVWADGVVARIAALSTVACMIWRAFAASRARRTRKASIRHGLKKCGECRKQFTVKVGTVFEHARMPLHKMLQAVHLMVSQQEGHQLAPA